MELSWGAEGGTSCGGAWGSGPGAFVGLFVDLDWADCFAWLAVKRFAEKRKICRQSMEFTFARGQKEEGMSAVP